jgi:hypothetical protein
VVLARNLEDGREGIRKRLDCWSDAFGDLYIKNLDLVNGDAFFNREKKKGVPFVRVG